MHGVGRGSGMEERSLEIGEVWRGEEGDDGDRRQVYTYFGKRFAKVYLVCLHAYRIIIAGNFVRFF